MEKYVSADVVIIGGGAIGCSVAYYLAKMKAGKVLLIERNTIGSGNTSWAASLLTKIRSKKQIIPFVEETYVAIQELEEQMDTPLGLHQVGSIHLASSDASSIELDHLIEIADEKNISHENVDNVELSKMLPWLAVEPIKKAVYMPEDGFLDAYLLTNTYAGCAKELGVTIMQHSEVLEVNYENDQVIGVTLENAFISTNIVVDAAGAWANLLSLRMGIGLPMAPVRSNYWITEINKELFPADQPIVILPDASAYTRPEAGALLFGLREKESIHFHPNDLPSDLQGFAFGDPEDRWNILVDQGHLFKRFFPSFESIGIAHYISGVSTYTPDGLFVLGDFPGMKGFYSATGCSGGGVAASGGIGRTIAELIVDQEPFCEIGDFRIDRFGSIDPNTEQFRQICADTRSKKKSG